MSAYRIMEIHQFSKNLINTKNVQDKIRKKEFTFCALAVSSRVLTSPHTPTVLKRSPKENFTFRPPIASSTVSTEMLATALKNVEEKELSACPVTDTQPKAPLSLMNSSLPATEPTSEYVTLVSYSLNGSVNLLIYIGFVDQVYGNVTSLNMNFINYRLRTENNEMLSSK